MSRGLIHHVEINVADLKRSIRFWGWLLEKMGYQVFQSWKDGQSWRLGETYLVFVQTDERFLDEPYHRRRTGLNHLAFHADSKAEVDSWATALREREIPILYADKHPFAGGPDHYAVFFEDPDRIKVEIVATELS